MNKHKSDQDNNNKEEPQISIELDDGVIRLPLSTFNDILDREVTNYISKNQPNEKNIIEPNDFVNVQDWKKKYEDLEAQFQMLNSIVNRLKRDLKKNKFAQPKRCLSTSVNQNVYVSMNIKRKMAKDALENSKKKQQIFTISDSEDDVIITDTSTIKPIRNKNENIIDFIDLDNNTQNLEIKCKPASNTKINVSIPDLKTNDNNKLLPITEAAKTLSNGEYLSTTIRKRKPGPKSKTMVFSDIVPFNAENEETVEKSTTIRKRKPGLKSKTTVFSDMVPFNAENEETVEKKKCLNECEVINNEESNTNKLLSSNSVKKLEVPKKYNHNFFNKSSILKYPPPYPLIPPHNNRPSWKNVPPIPNMTINTSGNKVTLTWDLNLTWQTAKIKMYELFVCQETDAPPNISMWKKKGNIEAELLPMACELEVFDLGYIYHFALRAVDVHNRRAPFAVQKTKV